MDNIGSRLRSERERLGLTQDEFVVAGGIGKRALIHYEKSERSPDAAFLTAIAAVGADVLYILTGERSQELPPEATLPRDESTLLAAYRACTPAAQRNLLQTAALLSAGLAPDPGPARMVTKRSVRVQSHSGHAAGRDVNITRGERNGRSRKP